MPPSRTTPEPGLPGAATDGLSLAIIVPVLNEAADLGALLDRLNQQRREADGCFPGGITLTVVDGGSHDGTVAHCHGRVDRVLGSARGRARQMNTGAAAAGGELLLFLHADTWLPADGLRALADAWQRGGHAGWGRFDVHIRGRSRWFPVIAVLMNWRSAWSGIATGDQAIFVSRVRFEAVGGYPDQPLMEDIELCRRLKRAPGGAPLRLRTRVSTSGRRWETRGVWRTILLMWRLRWRYWRGTPAEQIAEAYR
jgi:rSAM/selenodomain-associated transferase 2